MLLILNILPSFHNNYGLLCVLDIVVYNMYIEYYGGYILSLVECVSNINVSLILHLIEAQASFGSLL